MQTDEKSKESVLNNFVFQNHNSQQVYFVKDEYRNMCYQRRKKKKKRKKEGKKVKERGKNPSLSNISLLAEFIDVERFGRIVHVQP